MRLFLLTLLTMIAFAANSVLTRAGVADAGLAPMVFAFIRVLSGAIALLFLVSLRTGFGRSVFKLNQTGALSLTAYLVGFSAAYLSLDTGVGALILFGGVQITMFLAVAVRGQSIRASQMIGAAIAFSGLVVLLAPNGTVILDLWGVVFMIIAAIGWGIYSLAGQGSVDPLLNTAQNFTAATVLVLPFGLYAAVSGDPIPMIGVVCAIVSGVLMSALAYALWYAVLPKIPATNAALAQLSVPLIAVVGGFVFLNETPDWRFAVASVLVLGGIGISVIAPKT